MTTTRYLSVVAILCGLLGCAPVAAAPITTGRQVIDIDGAPMVVFTYRPPGCSDPSLLMVFHGVARNARTYRDDARALADRLCLLVLAPVFDKRAFPAWRYQRGGIVKDAVVQDARDWSGTQVLDLVAWARAQEGRPAKRLSRGAGPGRFPLSARIEGVQRGEDAGTGPRLDVQLAAGRAARRRTQRAQDIRRTAGFGRTVTLNRRWDPCDS